MATDLRTLLHRILGQLKPDELGLFIWHLTLPDEDGLSDIPPADLPAGSLRQAVVDKIAETYEDDVIVTCRIMRKMNKNKLAKTLEEKAVPLGLKIGPTATAPPTGTAAPTATAPPTGTAAPTATAAPNSSGPSASSMSGAEFLTQHKKELEQRIWNVRPLLSALYDAGIVNDEVQEEVDSSNKTRIQKNAALLAMVKRRGAKAQEALYKALKEEDPTLVEHLGGVV